MRKTLLPALSILLLIPAFGETAEEQDKAHLDRMSREHQHDKPVASQAAMAEPAQPVTAEELVYAEVGGKPVRGYLARPKNAKGPRPALIVIHEWWGLNDNIRAMTRRLAGEGYTALAVDLYGGAAADTPEKARELSAEAGKNRGPVEENLRQAYGYLEAQQKAPKVGVIGWCFGGGWSLNTAMLLPDKIDAAVLYYGRTETDPEKLRPLRMPVLGLFGAEDKGIPLEGVRQFERVMKELGKNVTVHVYEGADHAFANPSGTHYNAKAADDSWKKTTAFLKKHLG
jgi:carboxymethylenebutenolidase